MNSDIYVSNASPSNSINTFINLKQNTTKNKKESSSKAKINSFKNKASKQATYLIIFVQHYVLNLEQGRICSG